MAIALLAVSCAPVDDLNEIFVGKTWYMVGGRLNSQDLNKEVTNFYQGGRDTYKLYFQENSFSGTLATGETFSGRWSGDPKSRNLSMIISQDAKPGTAFANNVYTIMKAIKYYEGDTNYLILYSDKDNFIRFNYER